MVLQKELVLANICARVVQFLVLFLSLLCEDVLQGKQSPEGSIFCNFRSKWDASSLDDERYVWICMHQVASISYLCTFHPTQILGCISQSCLYGERSSFREGLRKETSVGSRNRVQS